MKNILGRIDALVNKLVKNVTLWIFGGLIAIGLIALKAYPTLFPATLEPMVYSGAPVVLQPEWDDDSRERFYQTSQGSLVMPYEWFRAIEYRTSRQLFASPEIQVRYGLLPDNDALYNPEGLPIGIVKQVLEGDQIQALGGGHQQWASLSCAACHTSQLSYKGTAMRIDGSQSFWNFPDWSQDLVFSLMLTTSVPSKFERFCGRVYGHTDKDCTSDEKKTLRSELKIYFDNNLISGAVEAIFNHTYPTIEGPTRTSALGRGVNGEFRPLDFRNVRRSHGPVSYPPLWYASDFDWVQSTSDILQPLGRNLTEAMGVNVVVQLTKDGKVAQFDSTARIEDLFWMETLMSTLGPPQWPEKILGEPHPDLVARGDYLFNTAVWDGALPADQAELPADPKSKIRPPNPNRSKTGYCARCHAPAWETAANGHKFLQLPLYRQEVMGTDPYDAHEFLSHDIYTGPLEELYTKEPNPKLVNVGAALTNLTTSILNKWFTDHDVSGTCRSVMEGWRPNQFRAPPGYPARPLDGYWATGPFLHNGSVRTMYQLLSPPDERPKKFWVGSREFDPVELGFVDEKVSGALHYDTSIKGNSNAGHEFRTAPRGTPGVIGPLLSQQDRLAIVEYMKVMKTVNYDEKDLAERQAILKQLRRDYEDYDSSVPFGTPRGKGKGSMADFCGPINAAESQK